MIWGLLIGWSNIQYLQSLVKSSKGESKSRGSFYDINIIRKYFMVDSVIYLYFSTLCYGFKKVEIQIALLQTGPKIKGKV